MIFGDKENNENKKEVRIRSPEPDEEEDDSKLKKEAESKLIGNSSEKASSKSPGLEDIHKQNKKIIELLEELKSEESSDKGGGGSPGELL